MNARLNSQLIEHELEVQRMSDYNRAMALQRNELASVDDPTLDQILTGIEGVNKLIFDHLATEPYGYNTPRKLLLSTPEQLAQVPGISLEMANKILEQIRKQRM